MEINTAQQAQAKAMTQCNKRMRNKTAIVWHDDKITTKEIV